MKEEQFERISKWQNKLFPSQTPMSKLCHLEDETKELKNEIMEVLNRDKIKEEFADCFILLFGAADVEGLKYDDICRIIDEKMEVNYKREWGKPDSRGVINHIKNKS